MFSHIDQHFNILTIYGRIYNMFDLYRFRYIYIDVLERTFLLDILVHGQEVVADGGDLLLDGLGRELEPLEEVDAHGGGGDEQLLEAAELDALVLLEVAHERQEGLLAVLEHVA